MNPRLSYLAMAVAMVAMGAWCSSARGGPVIALTEAADRDVPILPQFFSVELPELERRYSNLVGGGHDGDFPYLEETTYDFDTEFPLVLQAWLTITGTFVRADSSDLAEITGKLDGRPTSVAQPWAIFFNTEIPLFPGPEGRDGEGSLILEFQFPDADDLVSVEILDARLWFYAYTVPEPATLGLLLLGTALLSKRQKSIRRGSVSGAGPRV